MNKTSKFISVFIIITMVLTSITAVFADGEPEIGMSLGVTNSISAYGVGVGETIKISLNLDFGDDLIGRGGIYVMHLGVKFDANVLEPIDPETLLPIVRDENGVITEGNYASFAEQIVEAPPSVNLSSNGDELVILFGDTSFTSIVDPGKVMDFAFKVKPDLEVIESTDTNIRITNPTAYGTDLEFDDAGEVTNATSYECIVNSSDKIIKIRPPFRIRTISAQKQNNILEISDMSSIGMESGEPLMATITDSDGNVVAEEEAIVGIARYTVTFELDENTFAPGRYKLTLTHGATSASQVFEVVAKDEPLPEEPDEPDEPIIDPDDNEENLGGDTSGDKDNDKDDNKTDNNTSTGGLTGGATSDKKPTATDKTDKTDKDDDKTEVTTPVKDNDVVYPTDIAGHWAKSNIEYVFDYKLMNGYADGTFGADNSITRAEFATVMSRFLGLAENPDAAAAFADTDGHWAKGYIGALAAEGVVGGVSENAFDPDSNITREQIAVILDRAFDLAAAAETGTFADDAQISSWAYEGVYNVLAAGYMKGDTAGNFNPLANATRAEVATIIYRLHSAK